MLGVPGPSAGQAGPVTAGTAAGFVVGTYTMTAIYVAKARFGSYLYALDDALTLRPEILPIFVLPIAGGWLGAESTRALKRSGLWGGVGFAGGAALGALVGELVWKDDEGVWAGAIVGSAAGLLTGIVLGARDGLGDPSSSPVPILSLSIPLGGS